MNALVDSTSRDGGVPTSRAVRGLVTTSTAGTVAINSFAAGTATTTTGDASATCLAVATAKASGSALLGAKDEPPKHLTDACREGPGVPGRDATASSLGAEADGTITGGGA